MNKEAWIKAYEPVPQALENRVRHTLEHLDDAPERARGLSRRTAIIVIALIIAVCGASYAVYESVTARLFGWSYGDDWQKDIERGDIAAMGERHTLGDAVYTIEEMVYKTEGELQGLYGVVRITPDEGANVVLLPEDYSVNDPAGYLIYYASAEEDIADDDPSYAELAARKGAKLLRVRAAVNSVAIGGKEYINCFGESWLPQKDGSVLGSIEISDELPRAESYELSLWLSNWEVTPDGIDLCAEPDSTKLQYNWDVTVKPEMKGE